MIKDTIRKINRRIQAADSLSQNDKTELQKLLASLDSEITGLAKAEADHAESIVGFIERSAHEATRSEKNPELLKISLAGLVASVKGFEASHPRLAEDINTISTILANMGI